MIILRRINMADNENRMVKEMSWEDFRNNGFLLIINQFLHIFGIAICVEIDKDTDQILRVFPARVKFRGFSEESTSKAYVRVSEYMDKNAKELLKEAKE